MIRVIHPISLSLVKTTLVEGGPGESGAKTGGSTAANKAEIKHPVLHYKALVLCPPCVSWLSVTVNTTQ